MNKANVQERIGKIEAEIKLLKRSVIKRPDFSIDERNWKIIRPAMKRARAKTFKSRYGK
ncbi:MAG: hypothetical protein RLZZ416_413 [Candidatus Parcubacteria bacterium]|jgi:hypothetical protein